MTPREATELIEGVAAQLGEHFDAVQIMVSWNDEAVTHSVYRGSGNWHARQGMAHEFINQDAAQEAAKQIGEQINDKGDEDWQSK